jgi:Phosphoesterase family
MAYPHDLDHAHRDFLQQYDRGKMDGFDLEYPDEEIGGHQPRSTLAYSYIPRNEIQPYWDMATQYVLADRMFASNSGPSFAAHQYLIAGQSGGVDNPDQLDNTVYAWGCDSPKEARVDTLGDYGSHRGVFPCFDYRTLGVSHAQHEFGSVKFSDEAYNLRSLNGVDARADDLADCFDFAQQPRAFAKIAPRSAAFFLDQPDANVPPDND